MLLHKLNVIQYLLLLSIAFFFVFDTYKAFIVFMLISFAQYYVSIVPHFLRIWYVATLQARSVRASGAGQVLRRPP